MLVASSVLVMQRQLKLCARRSQADNKTTEIKTNNKKKSNLFLWYLNPDK